MSPEELAQGLAAAARVRRELLLALAERALEQEAVRVTEPPAPGSVMLSLDVAVGEFNLAEVVVTTAAVTLNGADGWGCVVGFDEKGALAAAVCTALGGHEVEALANEALRIEEQHWDRQAKAVAATGLDLA
ncbi:MAG: phosphonate C-P lyase system protein PhnG [Chloroflexi bacterium]|nr:phosphonate C-P lyase system protein PhnG [Chloroflexota bacterium]